MKTWDASKAKIYFSRVLDSAVHEPQVVLRRGKPAGVIVSYEEFSQKGASLGKKTMAGRMKELEALNCTEADFVPPGRSDRQNPLTEE